MTLEQLIEEYFSSQNVTLYSIKMYKGINKLVIGLKSEKIIYDKFIFQFETKVKDVLKVVDKVELSVKYDSKLFNKEPFINEIWPNTKELVKRKSIATETMLSKGHVNFDFEKNLIGISFSNSFIYSKVQEKNMDRFLSDYFSQMFEKKIQVVLKIDNELVDETLIEFQKKSEENTIKRAMEISKNYTPTDTNKSRPDRSENTSYSKKSSGGGYSNSRPQKELPEDVVYRKTIKGELMLISEIDEEETLAIIAGEVFMVESRILRGGKTLVTFAISDGKNSIGVKMFLKPKDGEVVLSKLKDDSRYIVEGFVKNDTFDKELVIFANAINKLPDLPKRQDTSEEKRVELHCHTNMSALDGITSVKKLVKRAIDWGHKAIAVTDHGVVQAFPDAMHTADGKIKILYGVEGYFVDDEKLFFDKTNGLDWEQDFIVFDIETTGLSSKNEMITEIGAVRIRNGSIVDTFSALINPQKQISMFIVELTGITNEMVSNEPTIDIVLPKFLEFVGDTALVAHNAKFDIGFIKEQSNRLNLEFDPVVLDTLTLSKLLVEEVKRFNLKRLCKFFNISLKGHHRAVNDATATAHLFFKLIKRIKDLEINNMDELNNYSKENMAIGRLDSYHIIIFAKNLVGLKDLYQIISASNIKYYSGKPLIPKTLLASKRENLLIGSACEAGQLYKAILNNKSPKEIIDIGSFYDYFEIQPIGNNDFMINKSIVKDKNELRSINKRIVDLGEQMNKPVAAAGDVHFIDPEDEIFRRILMAGKGFSDVENQPPLYLRTTEDMMKEFSYLGKEKCHEVVIEVPNMIADLIDEFLPIPDGTFPPIIEGSDDELREMCNKKAISIYGEPVPEIVKARLDRELNSIISNGYSVMYIIAQKLVTKSLEDGYLVGSRGSVGSSFAATMSDITEVNPLAPHYICDKCKKSEFFEQSDLGSGVDLEDKNCPVCNIPYRKDGHAIPFETFLGFHGDKEPDIDLNFAGVYQATSHKYTELLFGEGKTFKAGTIGTIADKTAYGYVRKYFEEREININKREIFRLARGCTGVKRTSGQHPGGIMVVPDYKDIEDFCPIQFPANDTTSDVKTTHFDYHSISGRLLKLDILGHDTPTTIRHLEELTDVDVQKIQLDDPKTIAIFTSTKTLNIKDDSYEEEMGSLAIPEFGTKFVRQMLKDTQPTTFSDLVRISGLSHGTDVWINNAQDLVRDGITSLKHVISTRDDIMNYLIFMELPHGTAFKIMEDVRKGKGLKEEYIDLMREKNVPEWYILSCNTIKYMFPKAHAVAYVMMSFRIAYFKVHHPLAFYATYFTTKVDDFDADKFSKGVEYVRSFIIELESEERMLSKKEQDSISMAEVVNEFYSRGFKIYKVDLYESNSDTFKVKSDGLLPPLRALQGVGENAARGIVETRGTSEIMSKDDLRKRAKITKTAIEVLSNHGCLKGLSETNQLSLFDF